MTLEFDFSCIDPLDDKFEVFGVEIVQNVSITLAFKEWAVECCFQATSLWTTNFFASAPMRKVTSSSGVLFSRVSAHREQKGDENAQCLLELDHVHGRLGLRGEGVCCFSIAHLMMVLSVDIHEQKRLGCSL